MELNFQKFFKVFQNSTLLTTDFFPDKVFTYFIVLLPYLGLVGENYPLHRPHRDPFPLGRNPEIVLGKKNSPVFTPAEKIKYSNPH